MLVLKDATCSKTDAQERDRSHYRETGSAIVKCCWAGMVGWLVGGVLYEEIMVSFIKTCDGWIEQKHEYAGGVANSAKEAERQNRNMIVDVFLRV